MLDLTDYRCWLSGKILAELGSEVIKIEKPGGDPGRRLGPFHGGKPDPERSLTWFAYNTSKKGITLNIDSAEGREIFNKLAARADFVIESFDPGWLDERGIGYSALSKANPRLVLTSITPFGQVGPYRNFKSAHITIMALSGLMSIIGDPDRPPLQPGFPLAYAATAGQAASATMMAYYARERDGMGQHVDVAMHHSAAMLTLNLVALWYMEKSRPRRAGQRREGRTTTGANPRYIWPCRDGHVAFSVGGGPIYVRSFQSLVQWMDGEGMATDFLKQYDWSTFDMSKITIDLLKQVEDPITRFFLSHTKAELFDGSIKRRIILFPVSSPKDIAQDVQLQSREFWTKIEYEKLGISIMQPAFFARTTHIPCSVRYRAPYIGEHNEEIYRHLGISKVKMARLARAGVI